MDLQTPIKEAGRIFSMQANKLEKLGIKTIEDLLYHAPARYENLTVISKIGIAQPGETVTIQGTVTESQNVYTRSRFQIQKLTVTDDTGSIECTWFNQPYILRNIQKGNFVSIAGRVEPGARFSILKVKEYEILEPKDAIPLHTGRLVPIYPETRGLSSKWIRNRIFRMLSQFEREIGEYLPEDILKRHNLHPLVESLKTIHFPDSLETVEQARKRLAFDELLTIQLAALKRREEWTTKKTTTPFSISDHTEKIQEFWNNLTFELTNAQKKAVEDIFSDMAKREPMNRLLEGDVGSGKTVVAAISMYLAYLNGFQSAFMAPTEILANQHFATISNLLSPLGVKIALITSNSKKSKNNELGIKNNGKKGKEKENLKNLNSFIINNSNEPDILIGTHALLTDKIQFNKLGLVVIDEQQRFGVEQRSVLREKGENPHFLTMTATPIPRTVFLTLYGDLELSYLDEMPHGRLPVKTWVVPKIKRAAAYEWIRTQITDGKTAKKLNQVFIVCPFIEESESQTTVKAATKEFEYLKAKVFKEFKLEMLHGRMKASEKDQILSEFQKGNIDVLVATPVVEVGIDIPNATIMVIEGAERFGLSQLHQLRGRVGRNDRQSYCLLFSDQSSESTIRRLKLLEKEHFGARLAEEDLKIRGAGNMYGTAQHGSSMLKIASFSDFELIEKTKTEAKNLYSQLASLPLLQEKLKKAIIQKVNPD